MTCIRWRGRRGPRVRPSRDCSLRESLFGRLAATRKLTALYHHSASFDSTARLWDVDAGTCLHSFARHTDFVYSIAFSPGLGSYLATGCNDGKMDVWRVKVSLPFSTSRAVDGRDERSSLVSPPLGSAVRLSSSWRLFADPSSYTGSQTGTRVRAPRTDLRDCLASQGDAARRLRANRGCGVRGIRRGAAAVVQCVRTERSSSNMIAPVGPFWTIYSHPTMMSSFWRSSPG